jgi:hypothetical protein
VLPEKTDVKAQRPRSLTFLLAGLIALSAVVGTLGFFPIAPCPGTHMSFPPFDRCTVCKGSRRITLLERWRVGPRVPFYEGWIISSLNGEGFVKESAAKILSLSGLKVGEVMTGRGEAQASREIINTGAFESVDICVQRDLETPGKVRITISVKER